MSIYTETQTLRVASEAAGFPIPTFKTHIHKGYLIGGSQTIEGGADTGIKRRFSFTPIIQGGVAKAAIDLGLETKRAFRAAAEFAHSGFVSTDPTKNRHPGLPFVDGETLLLVWDAGQKVVCLVDDMPFTDLIRELPPLANDVRRPFLVVPCNPVFERVCSVLGDDYRDVLAAEYGK